jgi:hypothetical protein
LPRIIIIIIIIIINIIITTTTTTVNNILYMYAAEPQTAPTPVQEQVNSNISMNLQMVGFELKFECILSI